jgi:alkylation response protein AidB-like acyl-CoA dehydrogenase
MNFEMVGYAPFILYEGVTVVDFTFTDEQKEIQKTILRLCTEKLNDRIYENDEEAVFPIDKWKQCGQFGIPGLPVPEAYGGIGQGMLTTALAIQSFGYGCKDEGLVFSVCAHMLTCVIPIWCFGTEKQKETYLPKLCNGDYIGGNGITEAGAGSDASAIRTKVEKEGNNYCIDGAKLFVTNGPVANLLIIYAKHPRGMRMLDISAFIVETDTPGFRVGQVFKKMGLRTCTLSEVILDRCSVGEQHLLGRERMGMSVFNHSMLWERIIMGAYHVGAMEQQYELTAGYAGMRKQFGQKIIEFQNVSDRLVDMKLRIEAARLMLYRVCWNYDNNQADLSQAAMLKLLTSESRIRNSLSAVQIFGAYGYMKESPVEKQLRDSIASTLYSGTSEIQKKIITEKIRSELT